MNFLSHVLWFACLAATDSSATLRHQGWGGVSRGSCRSLARTPCSRRLSTRLRTACSTWLLPLLLLTPPAALQAQFTYTTNDGTITITKYTGSDGTVIIPSTTNGLPVTSIADSAFMSCSNLTSVIISTTVTFIGSSVFVGCSGLTKVTIPDSVIFIGNEVFDGCTKLTSVTIGSGVTRILGVEFRGCDSLTNVTLGASVSNIAFGMFDGCANLLTITVDPRNKNYSGLDGVLFNKSQTTLIQYPEGKAGAYMIADSVTSITVRAFYYCTRLTNIRIGNGITSVGNSVFGYCTSLTNVTISTSVSNIEGVAFGGCANLQTITVDPHNADYSSLDGVLFNKSQTTLIEYPAGEAGAYTIPDAVTSIAVRAFYYCTGLTSIRIGNGVTNLGAGTFYGCANLASVTIANGITSIGDSSFEATGLTNVTIPNGVTSIGNSAFLDCPRLTSVTIGNGGRHRHRGGCVPRLL